MRKKRGYHKRSIKIIDPASIVMGLSIFSICSTEWIDLPMPPCIQIIFFSIRAASGRWLKSWLNLVHAHIPSFSPCKHLVSCRIEPKNWIKTDMFLSIPFAQCTLYENQIMHLCQQLRGFHVSSEHCQDIQSAQSEEHQQKSIIKKMKTKYHNSWQLFIVKSS